MINRNSTLYSSRLVCARSSNVTGRPGLKEPHSLETHPRRQLQVSRRGCLEAPRRPSEPPRLPSHLETKPVILRSVRQQHVWKSLPVCRTQAGKRADIVSLRKHLGHARRLASAIKQGQSYFHLLQKEEQEEREEEERQRMRREELLRTEPRPPSFSSDSDSDSEGWRLPAGPSWLGANEVWPRRKKNKSARPFTPVHHSLTSPLLSEAPREVIYRQLCCLSWLLEALTLDRSSRVGPLSACWDPKDPGRGRTTIKTLKKERAIESKWEQFVSAKPQRAHPKRPRSSSARLHTHRMSSFMSVGSLSALTCTTVGSSVSSLVPAAEENTESECPGAAEETDRLPSECLHTLSDVHQKVKTESQISQTSSLTAPHFKARPSPQRTGDQTGSRTANSFVWPKSCPAKPLLLISHLINNKTTMLQELKAAFDERVEEMSQSYINVLELKARERLNNGLRRYRAQSHVTESHGLPHHMTCASPETEAPNSNNKNTHNNNMWLSTLLSSLPEEVCRERAVSRVLEKLSGFAEQQTLRVQPQVFLRVLGGLEPWELCLPELCVAIQIATEYVVQMPRTEYNAWLRSRVTLPPQ
ncbi:coiled-coil domain-containing protein 60-like isoform X2 [Epinephelus moara]|uniref:coiled-coil domain-containing protein 60-like isoform X2 n=1 Tax=Epinephelus moara TaxID=300413 RepID=UPI00214F249D|nr:coiled-coil domain-containing protein 60-like isoform X2 [Epinephelus moara]XP_049907813.1 coiled-coil domain-containing protein 60-like isoform X2 [Epinephelus moara]XP_049907814.1 coiled-coil domain-containing protein 60-like isoform X2 [Epinephelus moara]